MCRFHQVTSCFHGNHLLMGCSTQSPPFLNCAMRGGDVSRQLDYTLAIITMRQLESLGKQIRMLLQNKAWLSFS